MEFWGLRPLSPKAFLMEVRPSDRTQLLETAQDTKAQPYDRLRALMAQLRNPDGGCPWDLEQSFATIAPYTVEEAYEVADAIDRGDMADLKDELGDLLLQVFFHAQMAEDAGEFRVEDVFTAITDKMIRRHPHVFGDDNQRSAQAQTLAWEEIKAEERAKKEAKGDASALAGVASTLPALTRAEKLIKRAARVGFDYPDVSSAAAKIEEELAETLEATPEDQAMEYGDLLFSVACLGYKLGLDPEQALKAGNQKFEKRFRAMEAKLGSDLTQHDLEAMDAAWDAVKKEAPYLD